MGPGEELFEHDAAAGFAEDFILHHRTNRLLRLCVVLRDHDSLAERKAVGLDNDRVAVLAADFREGRFRLGKHLIPRRRDIVFFHQIL